MRLRSAPVLALIAGAVFAAIVVASLLSGDGAVVGMAVAALAVIAAGLGAGALIGRRTQRRHRSVGDAHADERDGMPGAPFAPDRLTPLGDTPEAHDEISPHDLPRGHPGRPEAERLAGRSRGRGHAPTTRGSR